MGDELTLAIVLKTLLDSKGFEEAQDNLKKFTAASNDASEKGKGFAKELSGRRGAVADLTRVLLLNIGVTGAAGEAAKAAGLGMNALTAGAGPAGFVLAGLVTAAALLAPKFVEWAKSTSDTQKATDDLRASIVGMLPELEDYIKSVPKATEELKALFQASHEEAIRKQKKEIADLSKALAENEQQAAKLLETKTVIDKVDRTGLITHKHLAEATIEEKNKAAELTEAINLQRATLNALLAAEEDGVVLGSQIKTAIDQERQHRDQLRKTLEAQRQEEERLKQLRMDQTKEDARRSQANVKALADARKKHEEDTKTAAQRLLALKMEEGAHLANARAAVKARKDQSAADAESLAQSSSYYLSFFGHSKAVRIAQAIVDTYAAATRALADLGPIAGPIMAGVMIAAGLANVANIRKQEVGFDDPFNDMLAEKLGRKSAADFVRYFGMGFQGGMMGGGNGPVTNNSYTTVNRGFTLTGGIHSHSIIGASSTEQLKQLNRRLIDMNRLEARTRIGG